MSHPVLATGDVAPTRTFGPLTRTDFVRFAGASGDFNLVHHDLEYARAKGMPDVISIGLLQAAILGQYLASWVGAANVRSLKVRFTAIVLPGDLLHLSARVESVHGAQGDQGRTAMIRLEALRQTGEQLVDATARVAVA